MQAIGHMIPLGVAVAFSSVPIMMTIVILLSRQRTRSAIPFLIGWVAGIALVLAVCVLLAQAMPTARFAREPDTAIGVAEIIVGIALMTLAVIRWFRRPRGVTPAPSAFLATAEKLGPWSALGVGLILNLRPKALLLAIAAALSIRADAQSTSTVVIAIVVYTVIGASTVAAPIIAVSVAPKKMEPRLESAQAWLQRNGAIITALILIVIGAVVIDMGIQRL